MTDQAAAVATESYRTHRDYDATVSILAARTAEREGAFFLAHLQPGMRVLDVGCGPGTITLGLARAVAPAEVIGIDIAQSQVDAARARQRAGDHEPPLQCGTG